MGSKKVTPGEVVSQARSTRLAYMEFRTIGPGWPQFYRGSRPAPPQAEAARRYHASASRAEFAKPLRQTLDQTFFPCGGGWRSGGKRIHRRHIVVTQITGHCLAGHLATIDIESFKKGAVVAQRGTITVVGKRQDVWERDVVECVG